MAMNESASKKRSKTDSLLAVREEKYQAILEMIVHQVRDFDKIKNHKKYTLLAPNNAAFKKIPITTMDYLMSPDNSQALEDLISYHVLDDRYSGHEIRKLIRKNGGSYTFKTLGGVKLVASINNSDAIEFWNEANNRKIQIMAEDWNRQNGIVHVVDQVVLPFRFLY
jgi:uncharacterized surface protein with fasciclin (FAS1) repeats